MIISDVLKAAWAAIKHFFEKEIPALEDLASRLLQDEIRTTWPLIKTTAGDILEGKMTFAAGVAAILAQAVNVAEKDIADALGLEMRFQKEQAPPAEDPGAAGPTS